MRNTWRGNPSGNLCISPLLLECKRHKVIRWTTIYSNANSGKIHAENKENNIGKYSTNLFSKPKWTEWTMDVNVTKENVRKQERDMGKKIKQPKKGGAARRQEYSKTLLTCQALISCSPSQRWRCRHLWKSTAALPLHHKTRFLWPPQINAGPRIRRWWRRTLNSMREHGGKNEADCEGAGVCSALFVFCIPW